MSAYAVIPPSFLTACRRIFDLTLGHMLWSRRTAFLSLVAGSPVILAVFVRAMAEPGSFSLQVNGVEVAGSTVFGYMVWVVYLRFAVPALGVFYGTSLIADEVDDKTITYLLTRPIPRGAVVLGKYAAYLACTSLVMIPSAILAYILIVPPSIGQLGTGFPSLVIDLSVLVLSLAVYGALFALVGAALPRPLLTGLMFVFGWEPVIVAFPGYLKHLTITHYLQAFVSHAMPWGAANAFQSFSQEAPSTSASAVALMLIWAGSLILAVAVVQRREFVLRE